MSIELKSKEELESLIRQRIRGAVIQHVEVRPDPMCGWIAQVVADPRYVIELQSIVDRIASELRPQYALLGPNGTIESVAWEADASATETRHYVERGRRFQKLSPEQLNDGWVTAYQRFALQRDNVKEFDDYEAEMRLRKVEPPYERVEIERRKLYEEIVEAGPYKPGDRNT